MFNSNICSHWMCLCERVRNKERENTGCVCEREREREEAKWLSELTYMCVRVRELANVG